MLKTATSDVLESSSRLSRHNFKWLLSASGTGNLADGLSLGFLPIVATSIASTSYEVSWVDGVRQLPLLFLAIPAGVLLDRLNWKILLCTLNLARGTVLLLLASLLFLGSIDFGLLLTIALIIGCIEAVHDIALPTVLPDCVPRSELARCNGILSSTETTTNYFVGRSIGSSLASLYSATAAASINGLLYIATAVLFIPIAPLEQTSQPTEKSKKNIKNEIKEGFRYVWNERNLRAMALMGIFGNAAFGAVFATLILYTTQKLQAPEWSFGPIQASFAAGSILFGFMASRIIATLGEWKALFISTIVIALGFFVTPLLPFVATVVITSLLNGAAAVIWNTISVTYRQKKTPPQLLGRATSVFRLISWGAMPLGSFIGGPFAEAFGLAETYYLAASLSAINVLIALILLFKPRNLMDHEALISQ